MSTELLGVREKEDRKRGMVVSIVIHALILLLVILPFITFPIPPPGEQGILISFGMPDVGSGDDRPEVQDKEEVKPTPPATPPPVPEVEPEPEVEEAAAQPVEQQKEIITTETPEAIAIKQAEAEEAERANEAELQKQRELDEAKRQAELEAQKEAEAEAKKQADYDASKKQFGDLLSGSGKGNTNTSGNQGDPNGDPDASQLEGISTGSGMVGGGLSNRGVLYEPKINDSSQKTGRVVVKVCVDTQGKVTSADYTQKGSTTTDSELRTLAVKSARQFMFSPADIEKQCGTVTIDFKVK